MVQAEESGLRIHHLAHWLIDGQRSNKDHVVDITVRATGCLYLSESFVVEAAWVFFLLGWGILHSIWKATQLVHGMPNEAASHLTFLLLQPGLSVLYKRQARNVFCDLVGSGLEAVPACGSVARTRRACWSFERGIDARMASLCTQDDR